MKDFVSVGVTIEARQVDLTSTGPWRGSDDAGDVLPRRGELATDGKERSNRA